jgi:hypothetical protein
MSVGEWEINNSTTSVTHIEGERKMAAAAAVSSRREMRPSLSSDNQRSVRF